MSLYGVFKRIITPATVPPKPLTAKTPTRLRAFQNGSEFTIDDRKCGDLFAVFNQMENLVPCQIALLYRSWKEKSE